MTPSSYSVTALSGLPLVKSGDDLSALVCAGLAASGTDLADSDVVVLAQKIVSKAEGRTVDLATVSPSAEAADLARRTGKDARLVELILSESSEIVRERENLLIVRHKLGFVIANAGIDQSNVGVRGGEHALLLPIDPDASAARLRDALFEKTGRRVAILIIDSFGRAWRRGTIGTAIGAAGLPTLVDLRGRPDLDSRVLQSSELGLADEVAAAASLAMGQANEGTPVVLMRGLVPVDDGSSARMLIRPRQIDLFP